VGIGQNVFVHDHYFTEFEKEDIRSASQYVMNAWNEGFYGEDEVILVDMGHLSLNAYLELYGARNRIHNQIYCRSEPNSEGTRVILQEVKTKKKLLMVLSHFWLCNQKLENMIFEKFYEVKRAEIYGYSMIHLVARKGL